MTWNDLALALADMPIERRCDPVQIWPYSADPPDKIELHQCIGLYSVGELCSYDGEEPSGQETRSTIDNGHHPEHYVLFVDGNPFSEDGDLYYELQADGTFVGDHTGKVMDEGATA